MKPPDTREDDIVEEIFGEHVADPYRWLERDDPEVQRWVDAQNAFAREHLDAIPGRGRLRDALDRLTRSSSVGVPVERSGRVFHSARADDEDQPKLYVREAGHDRVIVDVARLDPERHLVALDWWSPSPDGTRVAIGLSVRGDEDSTLHLVDVASGRVLGETIPRARAASIAWLPDGTEFWYTRYPESGTLPDAELPYHRRVYHHRLGADWRDDALVWGAGRAREEWPHVALSSDGRWLVVSAFLGWDRTEIWVRDRSIDGAPFVQVFGQRPGHAFPIGFAAGRLLYRSDLDAPNRRIVAARPDDPAAHVEVVVPELPDAVIEEAHLSRAGLLVHVMREAVSELWLHRARADGSFAPGERVELPPLGSIVGMTGDPDSDAYVVWNSFVRPTESFRVAPSGVCESFARGTSPAGFDPDRIVVRQIAYPSKDGTRVPMFLLYGQDTAPDGDRPTVLGGYGGFALARSPQFSPQIAWWLDRGGVYAIANLRGGSERGEAWHRAGMLARKQNVFDDFVAAAEWLIAERWTRPERLCISGGSNGGLLVGAALTQRPDLFSAATCAVPLLDMVRYHHFRLARLWIPEYGDPDDPAAFRWLYAYSPYHRVRDGTRYPAVLFTTGAVDSRVDPMHAKKMAARLQKAQSGPGPILLRVEADAGHGVGKPRHMVLDESVDHWAFIASRLGVTP